MKLEMEAVEKFNLVSRLKEEEVLLIQEMRSFIQFYRDRIIPFLDQGIKRLSQ